MTTDSRLQPAEIVGGQIPPSPIPWQVSVQIEGKHIGCGGTILDTYTILSAAHCFDGYEDSFDGFEIRAGSIKRSSGGQVC
jgi:secreted trypsin-like serine protease